jgi:Tfp pilus assembly protein PilV
MRNKMVIVGIGLLLLGGCCSQVKTAVHAYASAVQQQTQVGQELLKRCAAGNDQPACSGVGGVLTGIETSAKRLED